MMSICCLGSRGMNTSECRTWAWHCRLPDCQPQKTSEAILLTMASTWPPSVHRDESGPISTAFDDRIGSQSGIGHATDRSYPEYMNGDIEHAIPDVHKN